MTSIASTDVRVAEPKAASKRTAKIKLGRVAAHMALLFFVALWTFPTVGLLISSVRDKDQLAVSGWWTALGNSTTQAASRLGRASSSARSYSKNASS